MTRLRGLLRRLAPRPNPSASPDVGPLRASLRAPEITSLAPAARISASLAQLDEAGAHLLLEALPGSIGADGAPLGRLEEAREALWTAALALAWLRRAGSPAPSDHVGRWLSGVDALYRLQGALSSLPGLPSEPSPPLACTLYRAALAWGLDTGASPPGDDALGDALVGTAPGPTGQDAPLAPAPSKWTMWTWRATGLAVAHGVAVKRPTRLYLDGREGRIHLDLEGLEVLWSESTVGDGDGAGGHLEGARVDGRKVRLSARGDAWSRNLLLEGARLVVKDSGVHRVAFHLGAPWELDGTAPTTRARADGLTMEIKLDPAWRWTTEGGLIQGVRGSGPAEVQASFEIRT